MQLHLLDPDYSGAERARANFALALRLALLFVALLWLVHGVDRALGLELARFGIRPRQASGLTGILWAPLLHADWRHLFDNSLPLLVLVTGMLYLYPHSALRVMPAVYLGAGAAVWALGRDAVHIGASGLVYGLAAYIFAGGILRRDVRAVAAAMAVYFLYGTLVFGILPIRSGHSWETHLAAAVLAVLLAIRYRRLDTPPRKRYGWEDEDDAADADVAGDSRDSR